MVKFNDCEKCPCYIKYKDRWGMPSECCNIRSYEKLYSCKLPLILRLIVNSINNGLMAGKPDLLEHAHSEEGVEQNVDRHN